MSERKRNNDPWVPLPSDSEAHLSLSNGHDRSNGIISPAPQDPLHQLIDSERYIQSLERKLEKLTKARRQEPTSSEIISSLALFHDDQMRRFVDDRRPHSSLASSNVDETVIQSSFVQRKLHPERQPLSAEEVAEIVKNDVLAENFEVESNAPGALVSERTSGAQVGVGVSEIKDNPSTTSVTVSESNTLTSDVRAAEEAVNCQDENESWANFDHMNGQQEEEDQTQEG